MFCDPRYECVTIHEVHQELFRTQKSKDKYPWRLKYKSKIKALGSSKIKKDDRDLYFKAIRNMIQAGKTNKKTGHFFNLSYADQIIAACSLAHNFKLTTVDGDLNDFIIQEFSGATISPLGIINDWIKKGILKWNDELQAVFEDWDKCNEAPQSKNEIRRFEKLSRYKYTGP
jgi:predicted nucleic acid-binding protein